MYPRLLKIAPDFPKSFFLLGPRGTGKTSWVKQCFQDIIYLDLLDSSLFTRLSTHPNQLTHLIPTNYQGWIVIDEVQKIPILLDEIHRLIENHHYRFILTGSSARKLRRSGVNLLAGRALNYTMHPLTAIELGQDFDLKSSLQYGHLPAIRTEPKPELYLKTYVSNYLREEVQQEGLVRKLGDFSRFLEVASFSQGSILNVNAVARETGVSQKTADNYFEILKDLLIADKLPIFTNKAKRELISHPKFYFFDVGVYRTIRSTGILDDLNALGGLCLETLFLQELQAINNYLELEYNFYFWRTKNKLEVDFIAYGPRGLIAFEIKSGSRVDNRALRGLRAFQQDYPMATLYLINLGERREYYDNISVIPLTEALLALDKLLAYGEVI